MLPLNSGKLSKGFRQNGEPGCLCSRAKGKCPEPYTREEVLEERFAELLDRLRFDDEVLAWVSQALRVSHGDEKQHHDDAIRRIQCEYHRLQNRIGAMYVDKLDGRIDTD